MNRWQQCIILICILLFVQSAQAASSSADSVERITLKKTAVIGSQELPRIVSIMSWKKTAPHQTPLLHNGIQMSFIPIDKNEFARELNYRRQMQQH